MNPGKPRFFWRAIHVALDHSGQFWILYAGIIGSKDMKTKINAIEIIPFWYLIYVLRVGFSTVERVRISAQNSQIEKQGLQTHRTSAVPVKRTRKRARGTPPKLEAGYPAPDGLAIKGWSTNHLEKASGRFYDFEMVRNCKTGQFTGRMFSLCRPKMRPKQLYFFLNDSNQ